MEHNEAIELLKRQNQNTLEAVIRILDYIVEDSENESKEDLIEAISFIKSDII